MLTNTFSADLDFYDHLESVLSARHPELKFEIPPAYPRGGEWPRPDVVITNPRTGGVLGVELRAGSRGKRLPIALLAQVRGVRDRFRAEHPESLDLVVITTGEIPRIVSERFDNDGVEYFEVSSPEEAIDRLEPWLERL